MGGIEGGRPSTVERQDHGRHDEKRQNNKGYFKYRESVRGEEKYTVNSC